MSTIFAKIILFLLTQPWLGEARGAIRTIHSDRLFLSYNALKSYVLFHELARLAALPE